MAEHIVDFGGSMAMLARIIESQSANLREEIVRCRDCKYWATEARFTGYCLGRTFDPNGFCSWAERKAD